MDLTAHAGLTLVAKTLLALGVDALAHKTPQDSDSSVENARRHKMQRPHYTEDLWTEGEMVVYQKQGGFKRGRSGDSSPASYSPLRNITFAEQPVLVGGASRRNKYGVPGIPRHHHPAVRKATKTGTSPITAARDGAPGAAPAPSARPPSRPSGRSATAAVAPRTHAAPAQSASP